MTNLIVWGIETVPDFEGFAAANGVKAVAMTNFAGQWVTGFPSTSTVQSSASAP